MRTEHCVQAADPVRRAAAQLREDMRQIEAFWFEVNVRRVILQIAEELEAQGRRVSIRAILAEIVTRWDYYIRFKSLAEYVYSLQLWKKHGLRSHGFKYFKKASARLRQKRLPITPDLLAEELGIEKRAVWRYVMRNPQKALMLGVLL